MGGNEISQLIGKILQKYYRIVFVFRKRKKSFSSFEQRVIPVNGYQAYKKLFKELKPSFIINMYSVFSDDINLNYNVNIKLSLFLINFFSNSKTKLVLIGTAAEYGTSLNKKKFKETDTLKPNNYYGLSKSIQSTILLKYAKIISTKTIVLRIFNIYGNITAKHLLIGKLNRLLIKKKNIFKLGSLKDYRDYVSSSKSAKMIIKCMIKGKYYTIYNIGSGKLIKVRNLVKKYLKKKKLTKYKIIEKNSNRKPNYSFANLERYKSIR